MAFNQILAIAFKTWDLEQCIYLAELNDNTIANKVGKYVLKKKFNKEV